MADSHWRLGQRREGGASGPSPSPETTSDLTTVGRLLRRHREELGLELRPVADLLCIRYPYLKAIEDGRIEDLPGPTYAVGFVKAYADHLGLDSNVVVERFKAEQQGLNSKTELVFPSPLPEGKVPSMAILIVGGLLSVGAYTGWVYYSSDDEQTAEAVPPLPAPVEKMAAQSEAGTGEAAAPQNTRPTEETVVDGTTPETPEMQANAAPARETPQQAEADGAALEAEPSASAETDVDAPPEPATASGGMMVSVGAAKVSASVTEAQRETGNGAGNGEAVPPAPEENQTAAVPPAPVAPPKPALEAVPDEKPALEAVRQPKEYGDRNSGSPIVMLATSPTWIEIRDTERKEILLTRVLYAGDRYFPPNRSGLVMMTGNAGGLEISVDGKKVPPIGRKGDVKRDVSLNPETLRQHRSAAPVIGLQPQQSQAPAGTETAQ